MGPSLAPSVSHTAWMQVRQKLCPHGSVTGSVKMSWQTGHLKDSSAVPIALLVSVTAAQYAPGLPHEIFTGLFWYAQSTRVPQHQITIDELKTSRPCLKPWTPRRPCTIQEYSHALFFNTPPLTLNKKQINLVCESYFFYSSNISLKNNIVQNVLMQYSVSFKAIILIQEKNKSRICK